LHEILSKLKASLDDEKIGQKVPVATEFVTELTVVDDLGLVVQIFELRAKARASINASKINLPLAVELAIIY
jgi:hypothetical protein